MSSIVEKPQHMPRNCRKHCDNMQLSSLPCDDVSSGIYKKEEIQYFVSFDGQS